MLGEDGVPDTVVMKLNIQTIYLLFVDLVTCEE